MPFWSLFLLDSFCDLISGDTKFWTARLWCENLSIMLGSLKASSIWKLTYFSPRKCSITCSSPPFSLLIIWTWTIRQTILFSLIFQLCSCVWVSRVCPRLYHLIYQVHFYFCSHIFNFQVFFSCSSSLFMSLCPCFIVVKSSHYGY